MLDSMIFSLLDFNYDNYLVEIQLVTLEIFFFFLVFSYKFGKRRSYKNLIKSCWGVDVWRSYHHDLNLSVICNGWVQ